MVRQSGPPCVRVQVTLVLARKGGDVANSIFGCEDLVDVKVGRHESWINFCCPSRLRPKLVFPTCILMRKFTHMEECKSQTSLVQMSPQLVVRLKFTGSSHCIAAISITLTWTLMGDSGGDSTIMVLSLPESPVRFHVNIMVRSHLESPVRFHVTMRIMLQLQEKLFEE